MDRICNALLDKICSLSSIGRYAIISEDEFLEVFPDEADRNGTELRKALKALISDGYVDLKYSDGEMYCVSPLKKYAPEPEIPILSVEEKPQKQKNRANYGAFLAGFLGGAAGSLIISLIFALI